MNAHPTDIPALAAIETYPALRRALANRRRALGLTQMQVDQIAGLQDGYTGKIEAGIKHLGDMSFECLLGALGLRVVLAASKHREFRLESSAVAETALHQKLAIRAATGGLARAAKLSPAKRKRVAANAARIRWKKFRAEKVERERKASRVKRARP